MKKLSLKLLAYISFPLMLICSYQMMKEAYDFSNHVAGLEGAEQNGSLFDWYVNDFISTEFR